MKIIFKINTLFICLLINSLANAQTFDRKVISSAGKDASNGLTGLAQRFMTYTIGEPLIYRGSNSSYSLSNGFIQPIGVIAVSPPASTALGLMDGDIAVYPNPFGTFITLNTSSSNEEEINVQLIDINGKLILQELLLPKHHKLEIPSHCAPGTYLLNCYTPNGQFIQQTRLIKMNN
ncbi:MAG: T9SS type A sorting domain-containing protein [Flavobacteriales bacterium]|nr:T9SS type A sorting domain-containing protein [Flavobacteriales bacterium]